MIRTILLSLAALVLLFGATAFADRISRTANRLADEASSLARSADRSDDRGIRRKFAPRAADLSDDLAQLARAARKDAPAGRLAREAGKLANDAGRLADLADESNDRRERKALRSQASRIERQLVDLRRDLDRANDDRDRDRRPDRRPEARPQPRPMSPEAFKALVNAIKAESFESNKLGVVSSAVQGNFFVTSQIATVMDLFSFGSGKVESAATMWKRVLDPQNSFVLYTKLTFSSDKDKLRKRIGR